MARLRSPVTPTTLLFQETQTKLSGRHTFRYGVEILRQLATQRARLNSHGRISYQNAFRVLRLRQLPGRFQWTLGAYRREFADTILHPDQLRQSYFFQDTWKAAPALTLTLGLRYENFGQPANALRFPAFSGFDPDQFLDPNRVNVDNNNFGPAFGLAWSPSFTSGWLAKLFGDRKTVWRGGFQISYDGWFTQMISLGLAVASPNGRTGQVNAPGTGRGFDDWFARIPASGSPPEPLNDQGSALDKDLRNPYTERWSFGFQRQLAGKILLDTSYVGSVSHKLTTRADLNPRQLNGRAPLSGSWDNDGSAPARAIRPTMPCNRVWNGASREDFS